MDLEQALWTLLGFVVLPVWLLAGAADWWCHRRTDIAHTSGPRESALHLLLYLQIALPVLMLTWLQVTAATLTLFALAVVAHMLTSWWDTRYAQPRRFISPIEQQVHSWLEMLPVFALLILAVLHRDQLTSPDWSWLARSLPAPWHWALPCALLPGLLMLLEEWWRGVRARGAPAVAPHG
jgi:hypothetical protein